MKQFEIRRPIGLDALCSEIEKVCRESYMYKRGGRRLDHLIVPLDSGSGRTTIIEYMVDKYKECGVLSFNSGIDDYVEVTFDGTLNQLNDAFRLIDDASTFDNEFSDLVAMDISNIAKHLNEIQLSEFLKKTKSVCDHSCVIFFVHANPSKNEEILLNKLCEAVDKIRRIDVEDYSQDNIKDLIIKDIEERGIEIMHSDVFQTVLTDIIEELSISSVKQALTIADTLVQFADFSSFTPVIDETALNNYISTWADGMERRDVK